MIHLYPVSASTEPATRDHGNFCDCLLKAVYIAESCEGKTAKNSDSTPEVHISSKKWKLCSSGDFFHMRIKKEVTHKQTSSGNGEMAKQATVYLVYD